MMADEFIPMRQGVPMKRIAEFMMEACFLKHLPRSGYQYLGTGRESVAEHVYAATMFAYVLAQLTPEADLQRLVTMCLLHDLPETRVGDLNYVQKQYVDTHEDKALADTLRDLPFKKEITAAHQEYNAGESLESKLAHDADQLALMIDLKYLKDRGHRSPDTWLPHVTERLKTDIAIQLAKEILSQPWDGWWRNIFC
jgi:putative hydrolase of HD superfamily